ncbi:unnamed protein product [Cochlearia groenlandica]
MASFSSSSSSRTWKYNVFASFHGPDVRKTFISHLRKQFNYKSITMFDDQGIERSHTIALELTQAIRESRISIVVLSKNYASSSWCLDELLEILKCKEDKGQIVMPVFYQVDPSHVRKHTQEFGSSFDETCGLNTEEKRRRWSQALNDVGNIAGDHFLNWDDEADMIEKIARDVSDKLNDTPSRDFHDMVGLETHMMRIESLLNVDNVGGTMMVGIYGHAGIGKTTIARALQIQLSNKFQLTCLVENLRGNYHTSGLDDYGSKLRLQEHFLSNILNHVGMKICHLGVIQERLFDQRVLIILDDVDDVKQLEALANETTWFGPGSRIIVTTENKELLQRHGIDNMYNVEFPSDEEALKILCIYAFRKKYPRNGYKKLAKSVTKLCGNLPLGLRVVGSYLRGKDVEEWEQVVRRLGTVLDRDIEDVLRVGYESLAENEQTIFLHIAVFFNYKPGGLMSAMLADNNLDIKHGLKILEDKSLIRVSAQGEIVMHKLLQQMGIQAIHRQYPWKRQILIDAQEICDVLENDKGTRVVSGISLDTSGIDEVIISDRGLRRMRHLRFLRVYKTRYDGNDRVYIPEEMEFPSGLRLLHWNAYPRKSLPPKFCPEKLVELHMRDSHLEKLWEGNQPLANLRTLDLSWSRQLKELPDLSKATNLERLNLTRCENFKEIPLSIANLHKLEELDMFGCLRLTSFPDITTNIDTSVEEIPAREFPRIYNPKTLTSLPGRVKRLNLSYTNIDKIPDCIKGLNGLQRLYLSGCKKLASLPELPSSLALLMANGCESLERVTFPLNTPNAKLIFTNCFKLSVESRKAIVQRSFLDGFACLPGRVVPKEFNHRTRGNSLTIRCEDDSLFSASCRFKVCVKVLPNKRKRGYRYLGLWGRIIGKSGSAFYKNPCVSPKIRTEHLCIFHCDLPEEEISLEVGSEILFELRSRLNCCKISDCGVRILTHEEDRSSNGFEVDQVYQDNDDDWSYEF